MKNVIFICLVTLFQFTASAGNSIIGPGEKGAILVFENTTINYGKISNGSEGLRIFTFTNTGDKPLVITNAKGSCGCTVPSYPTGAIAPGATSQIEVRYDTKRTGIINKTITVTSNAGEPVVLKITGEVLASN
jgi:hypothetical protein